MKYCNQQKNEKPLNAQRDRVEGERGRGRQRVRAATGSNNSWLGAALAAAAAASGSGWQHPLAKISFCVKSLK